MNHTITGAELIVQLLERQGVDRVAGIAGGAILPLHEARGGETRLRQVLARHPQAAGFIAQGMARLTGKAGVCVATAGAGLTNLLTAIADARMDSVPLVCIAGQVPLQRCGAPALQELKSGHLVDSITKANFLARSVEDLLWMIPEAFRIAESGRPGPVLLDVPEPVQSQRIALPLPPAPELRETGEDQRHPTGSAWATAAAMINAAQRPLLYLGSGVVKARAWDAARALAEKAALPTTTSLMALGSLPQGHALSLGPLGTYGRQASQRVLDECDLLIAVGARYDGRAGDSPGRLGPLAQIIDIDLDGGESGRPAGPTLALQADAARALQLLLPRVRSAAHPGWWARIDRLRADYPAEPAGASLADPGGLIAAVARLAGPEAVVSADVGQPQMWVARHYPFARPDHWLSSVGLGAMGFGLPAAMGAALAQPDLPNVCFTDDDSLLVNVQELATLAELNLPVKIVLLDPAAPGLARRLPGRLNPPHQMDWNHLSPTDYGKLAEAFGIRTWDLGQARSPQKRLEEALRAPGPALIRAPIAADRPALPKPIPRRSSLRVVEPCVDTEA